MKIIAATAAVASCVLAGCGLADRAAWPGGTADAARNESTTFAVISDVPNDSTQLDLLSAWIEQINGDAAVEWTAHLGDIKSGDTVCSDERLTDVRAVFDLFTGPLVYTPGDNEWTDCHAPANGGHDPAERLSMVRRTFFPVLDRSLGRAPMPVSTQRAGSAIENVWFESGPAVVAAVHVVGSNNGLAPQTGRTAPTADQQAEVAVRLTAAIDTMRRAFDAAEAAGSSVVVIMMQANLFTDADQAAGSRAGFTPIVIALADLARDFDGEVLLLDGDNHRFVEERPLAAASTWPDLYDVAPVENLTRITVEGASGVDEYLRVTVGPDGVAYERVHYAVTAPAAVADSSPSAATTSTTSTTEQP